MSATQSSSNNAECVGLVGSLKTAWEQTFPQGLPLGEHSLVIVWHEGWMHRNETGSFWDELFELLKTPQEKRRILVVIFHAAPVLLPSQCKGDPLGVLLHTLAEGASANGTHTPGWVSISEIDQFLSRAVEWAPVGGRGMSLLRLCEMCSELLTANDSKICATLAIPSSEDNSKAAEIATKTPRPTLDEFFGFLAAPMIYRARKLHAAGEDADSAKRGLRLLKWLEARVFVPNTIPLKVLLVENDPDKLREKMNAAFAGAFAFGGKGPSELFSDAKVYLLRNEEAFDRLMSPEKRKGLQAEIWNLTTASLVTDLEKEDIPWEQLDLILQDLVLDNNQVRLRGLEFVTHYFEECPQALVFLLTSLDVESLVGSGDVNWRYVDAILSKDATETLAYEYRRCFRERFGRMFWPDWCSKIDEPKRKMLRGLFGSLRKWQIEPDILWHGQSLPEMIDHANRHITALWRLTNDFIGTLLEYGGEDKEALSLEHRVSLAVGIWMHDVGHRGDEYVAGPMEIRASHAGISERLLLRNPSAYGLAWLLDDELIPNAACRRESPDGGRDARLECRNRTDCVTHAGAPLCQLRHAGLLCRHHQSNAPLDKKSVGNMAERGKEPSVYSLMPRKAPREMNTEGYLAAMTRESEPAPSPSGNLVRTLEEFTTHPKFRVLAGLLRMLDALQLHRSRVGTAASLTSFNEFLGNRFGWCSGERLRLEKALRAATPGTTAFLRNMGDLTFLEEYELLLNVQYVHFWRQAAAHEVEVNWSWQPKGTAFIDIAFTLNERALDELRDLRPVLPKCDGKTKQFNVGELLAADNGNQDSAFDKIKNPGANTAARKWAKNVKEEVANPEHKSQYGATANPPADRSKGYLGALKAGIDFRVMVVGTDQTLLDPPAELLSSFSKAS